jgi:DNA-binding NtrC family response regulator
MPLKCGDEVLREIHPLRPEVPVILTSGYSESDAAVRFRGLPIAGFLQKPYRPSELVAKVRRLLGQDRDT